MRRRSFTGIQQRAVRRSSFRAAQEAQEVSQQQRRRQQQQEEQEQQRPSRPTRPRHTAVFVLWGFSYVFYLAGERVSGRGRPLRGGGGGSSSSGGGETRVHAAATGERAGSCAAVRGLLQSWRLGQNLRPGGTSAGSCGKKPDKRARGREPERRARDTDRQR